MSLPLFSDRILIFCSDDDDDDEGNPMPETEEQQGAQEAVDEDRANEGDDSEPKVKTDPDAKQPKNSKHDPTELRIYTEDELSKMSRDRLVADVSILEGKPRFYLLIDQRI